MKHTPVYYLLIVVLAVAVLSCKSSEDSITSVSTRDSVVWNNNNAVIEGHVMSGLSYADVAEATVTAFPSGLTTKTNKRGMFRLQVTPGYCELVIEKEGYGSAQYMNAALLPSQVFTPVCLLERKPTARYVNTSYQFSFLNLPDSLRVNLYGKMTAGEIGTELGGIASNVLVTVYASEEGYHKGEIVQQILVYTNNYSSDDLVKIPVGLTTVPTYKRGGTLYLVVQAANIIPRKSDIEGDRGCYLDLSGQMHYTAVGPPSDLITVKIPD